MTFPKLAAIIDRETADGNACIIRSPAVGLYSLHPEPGAYLMGGNFAGRLMILNRTHDLVLPAGVWGQVGTVAVDDKVTPVEYGQALFHLHQRGLEPLAGEGVGSGVAVGQAAIEGTRSVMSPTDGIFYLRPNPHAEPYVRVGDRVAEGQTLGLVEVMKCFNPIQYGGASLPPEAEIVEICAQDGTEIKAEQVLFLVR
jgi:acetyl-CoA carboxylase biotin carboxyl carrier protein